MSYKTITILCFTVSVFSLDAQPIHTVTSTIIIDDNFTLGSNIEFDPSIANTALFRVTNSNITIDLAGRVIYQKSSNFLPNIDALSIDPSISHITIKNVFSKNFSGVGLRINNGCSYITIEHSMIHSCNAGGIFYDGSQQNIRDTSIDDCVITSCTGASGSPAYGIKAINVSNLAVSDSMMSRNDASLTASGFGAYLDHCDNINFFQCRTNGNGGNSLAAGIAVINSKNCIFEQAIIHNNTVWDTTATGTVCGAFVESSTGIYFNACRIQSNENSATSGFSSFGILIQNGQTNIVRNSLIEFNKGAKLAAGICLIGETGSHIEDTIIRNTSTIVSGSAFGLLLKDSTNHRCQIKDNNVLDTSGITQSIGYRDERAESTSVFVNNYGYNNGINYSVSYPPGVVLPKIMGSLSSLPGLPPRQAGRFDNIDISP